MSEATLQPCILCHAASGLTVKPSAPPASMNGLVQGFVVWCEPCQLRGPWRATEAGACAAWNYHVTPEPSE